MMKRKNFIKSNSEILAEDHKSNPVALIRNNWHLAHLQEEWPRIEFHKVKEQNSL